MRLSARRACHLNVAAVIVFGIISRPSLDALACVWAEVEEWRHVVLASRLNRKNTSALARHSQKRLLTAPLGPLLPSCTDRPDHAFRLSSGGSTRGLTLTGKTTLCSYRARPLFEPHYGSLDVLTPWSFKGPQIVSRLLKFNAREIHLRRALWAIWTRVHGRVFKRVLGKRHLNLPCLQAGVPELSATDA